MNLFSLVATLGLDTSGFSKDVDKAVDEGKKLGDGLTKALGFVTKVGGAIMVAGGTAYVATVKKAIDATADLEQNIGGSQTTWAGMASTIHDYALMASKDVGIGTSKYLEMTTRMGNLLQGMGIDNSQAATLTVEAIQRTADVAAALNVPIEDAMQAVQGMAKANYTMMDNLGVSMSETTLHAYALEKGIRRGTKNMSQAEKIALAFEMYMDKTAQHAGTFARESEGLGGALTVLKAEWQNFLDGSGDPSQLADSVMGYIDVYAKMVSEIAPRIWESFKIVAGNFGERIGNWVDEQGGWIPALQVPVDWALGELGLPDSSTIAQKVIDWWNADTLYDKIKAGISWTVGQFTLPDDETVQNAATKLKSALEATGVFLSEQLLLPMWEDISPTVTEWWNGISSWFAETFTFEWKGFDFPDWATIKSKAEEFWKEIKKKLSEMFTFTINLGNFTFFGGGEDGGQDPYHTTPISSVLSGAGGFGNNVNITQNIMSVPVNASDLSSQLSYNLRFGVGR